MGGQPTVDQVRRANEAVEATLGLFALTTPRNDRTARFGFECALNAIVEADKKSRPPVSWAQSVNAFGQIARRFQESLARQRR